MFTEANYIALDQFKNRDAGQNTGVSFANTAGDSVSTTTPACLVEASGPRP
jgi:hypothetical protein